MKLQCRPFASSSHLPTKKLWKAVLGKDFLLFGFFFLSKQTYNSLTLDIISDIFCWWCQLLFNRSSNCQFILKHDMILIFVVLQSGCKSAEADDPLAEVACGHEESSVLAVSHERHSVHQFLELHHGQKHLQYSNGAFIY